MKTHEIITLIRYPLEQLRSASINLSSIRYLDMFYEYRRMTDEGLKKTYIVAALCEKYNIGRTKFFELISSFETEILPPNSTAASQSRR
jgi:hypothetical protein